MASLKASVDMIHDDHILFSFFSGKAGFPVMHMHDDKRTLCIYRPYADIYLLIHMPLYAHLLYLMYMYMTICMRFTHLH